MITKLGEAQTKMLKESCDMNSKFKYFIGQGSVRSGKTESMTLAFVLWAMKRGGDYIVAGKSMGAVRRNIVPALKRHIQMLGGTFELSWATACLTVGKTKFWLFGAVNDKSQDTLQGMTAYGGYFDEVTLFPKTFLEQAKARCSVEGARLYFTTNPEGPTHPIKINYINAADDIRAFVLHFTLEDNPSLSQDTKDFYKESFSGVFYDRMIKGLWAVAEGVIFRWFQKCKVQTLPIENCKSIYCGIDMGIANTTAAVITAEFDKKIYVVDEYYYEVDNRKSQPLTVKDHADKIAEMMKKWKCQAAFIDPSAAALYTEMKKLGMPIRMGDNDVLEGVKTMDVMFHSTKLQVGENCKNLLNELVSYRWDGKKQDGGVDAPIKEYDHAIDALRYNIYTRYRNKVGFSVPIAKPKGY